MDRARNEEHSACCKKKLSLLSSDLIPIKPDFTTVNKEEITWSWSFFGSRRTAAMNKRALLRERGTPVWVDQNQR